MNIFTKLGFAFAVITLLAGCSKKDIVFEYERACSYDHEEQKQKTVEKIVGDTSICVPIEETK